MWNSKHICKVRYFTKLLVFLDNSEVRKITNSCQIFATFFEKIVDRFCQYFVFSNFHLGCLKTSRNHYSYWCQMFLIEREFRFMTSRTFPNSFFKLFCICTASRINFSHGHDRKHLSKASSLYRSSRTISISSYFLYWGCYTNYTHCMEQFLTMKVKDLSEISSPAQVE